ncbi:MAG TPA: type II toxin-antitoxin system PemK/MazF family toxin [Pirellulales bacterium]|nr:type II toxin-antitoxin system PemK/MazF family toxin [Pirellulales bacterium]
MYRVALDPTVGHEIRRTRPAVVISNDHMNELAATILVMPITAGHHTYFHWIEVTPPEGGLTKPSSIITEQIRTIDKSRLRRRLGAVRAPTMESIEQAIRDHFGLPEGNLLAP